MSNHNKLRYSIIGLGKLGCSMAAGIASRGYEVIGVDVIPEIVEKINAGLAPVVETDLQTYLTRYKDRIRATLSFREAILQTDVTFVIVPTPSDEKGGFSLDYVKAAFTEVGKALADKDTYHLVVLTSTVLPGSTRYGLLPILEKYSGKTCSVDFGLCYSPEFIALGSVIHDFLNPDLTLVGEMDRAAGEMLEQCYRELLENNAPCRRMSVESAELAKISLNTYVTTKITFANMLADLCERIPGANVDDVTGALGIDSRIGRKYLTGAVGYGGPCFPRDNVALSYIAREIGYEANLPAAVDSMNRGAADRLIQRLSEHLSSGQTVAVLGLAYKPATPVVEESQGVYLANRLCTMGFTTLVYDPLAGSEARQVLEPGVVVLADVPSTLQQADAVVIMTPDPVFKRLKQADFPRKDPPLVVFDAWRLFISELSQAPGIKYIPVGIGAQADGLVSRLRRLWTPASIEP
jgi:UDPglucose 6-dehydrogenase